jgi:glycosyltransferase involved in cell wall biosynthesis
VEAFRASLPGASIHVFDNNSTDATAVEADAAGADVTHEPLQGKGNVVRRMFADIDADIYVLADGDATYDASSAPEMIATLIEGEYDMVAAVRRFPDVYRPGHKFGNDMMTSILRVTFGSPMSDVLSGYRVFSRRFVKSFPAMSRGFDIEAELTIHALELRMKVAETETPYRDRAEGSTSKLRTFRDGFRILGTIALLLKEERPMAVFGGAFLALFLASLGLGLPVVAEFSQSGLVPRLPSAILAASLMLLAFLSLTTGLILDTVTKSRRELKRLHYLALPSPWRQRRQARRPLLPASRGLP